MGAIHFADGRKNYEIQQTIQPGEQMWLNFSDLIHHSVPDRKGNALPADVTSGTYDLEDLDPGLGGNLIEGKVVLDKTWGHLTYGCLTCCGYTPYLSPNPTGMGVGGDGSISTFGTNNCTGANGFSLYTYFNQSNARWSSGNTSIATVTSFKGHGVAPGTTIGYALATVPSGDGGRPKNPCPQLTQEGQNNVAVAPQITSIVPSTGQAGGSSAVAISGSGFGVSPTVNVTPSGIGVSGVIVGSGGTLINALFTIPAGATIGPYSVSVSVPSTDGGGSQTSNSVTFTVTACASVATFKRQSWIAKPTTGELDITYTWGSSTGKQSDLAACQLAEYVTYPGNPGIYTWPRPPFGQATDNPTPGGGNGANSVYIDMHLPPASWIKPYIAASFTANQTYQYVCPCVNGGNQVQLGQYTITRSVTQNSDGTYMYTVTKSSGESASLNPLP